MRRATVRVGTEQEFFERGRRYARLAREGEPIPESHLITFEDLGDLLRVLSPAKVKLFRAVKSSPGSIAAIASRLRRDRSAVTRDVAELQRFGLVQVAEEVHPGHGRIKRVSATAREIRIEAMLA